MNIKKHDIQEIDAAQAYFAVTNRLKETIEKLSEDRDALLVVAKRVYAELDNIYDVDQRSDGSHRESPFSGAGQLMKQLRRTIEKVEA